MKAALGSIHFVLVAIAAMVTAQGLDNRTVTEANFELAKRWSVPRQLAMLGDPWVSPLWLRDGNVFFYLRRDRLAPRLFSVDLDRSETRDLTLSPSLRALLAEAPSAGVSFRDLRITRDGDGIELDINGRSYRYTPSTDGFSRIEREGQPTDDTDAGVVSPDGRFRVNVGGRGLVLESLAGQVPRLEVIAEATEDDGPANPVAVWSADSRFVAFIREDWSEVQDLWLIDHYADPRPRIVSFKWPMPGENVEQYSLWVYDTRSRRCFRVRGDRWPDQTLAEPRWAPDSRSLYFTRMSRDWMSLDLCAADPLDGECEVLIEERGHRQIITRLPYHVLDTTGEILWWSMARGWGHYTLHDPRGQLIHRVTSGGYHSGKAIHIDEEGRVLYFMGNALESNRNPYYHHLYRTNLDGSDLRLLTPEDAEHEVTVSDTGDFFVDNFSRADMAPRAVVRDSAGRAVMDLGQADISRMVNAGWKPPEIFTAKAADGTTDLWGVLFKPFDFDPMKRYPVITYGYPGKETEFLPFKFCHNDWVTLVATSLAQYGFVVVVSGNRGGTTERSYEYYDFGEDRLRDYPVADKRAVLEALGQRHPYLDLSRVGILGQSSGGFMAAAAILLEPDFFKVAVAKAGNHDNDLYYHHWNERYGRVTQRVEGGRTIFESTTPSNNEIASNLEGRLLIVHGDMDRYVPPSLSYRLAHDLMMADKRFDMFVVPNGDHFWGDNMPYVHRYIELYFVENLMGDGRWSADIFR